MCEKEQIAIERLKNVEGLLKAEFYCEDCQMKYTLYSVKNFNKMYNPEPKHQFKRRWRARNEQQGIQPGSI